MGGSMELGPISALGWCILLDQVVLWFFSFKEKEVKSFFMYIFVLLCLIAILLGNCSDNICWGLIKIVR